MITICKNCNQNFKGHFCNNCGQSAATHKINFHFLWHDIQHGFFHFDRGVLFTAKQLFTRPGTSIREFIEGKRVRHFKPISLVVLLATIYGVLSYYFHIKLLDFNIIDSSDNKIKGWMNAHYALVSLLTLPVYAFGTFIAFKKQGYNFLEHLVLNTFLIGQRLILHIVIFPFVYAFDGTPTLNIIITFTMLIDFILMVWVYCQFFNNLTNLKAFFLAILSYLIFLLIIAGVIMGVSISYFFIMNF